MAHWADYSLRGWLSFLSFMHIGTAFRCFFDRQFLYSKIFTTEAALDISFTHVFGVLSVLQAMVLFQAAIYLYDIAVQKLAIGSLLLWILYFSVETLVFNQITIHFASLFPVLMSGTTLVWVITFHYFWQPWKRSDLEQENEWLIKGISAHKQNRKKR